MIIQKEMVGGLFKELSTAKETGKKVVYTFIPGNLSELIQTFDMLPVYPEINALQSAMRKKSSAYIREAEKNAHSEDVCTYVKCDVGMMLKGNIGPTGEKIPEPDLLLLSYTGCFTFMKWFETLNRLYPNAEVAMIHTPYKEAGEITEDMRQYMVKQFKEENETEFSKLCNDESELVEDVLKLLTGNNIKELGQKIIQNQEYLETIGVSNEKLRDIIQVGQKSSFGAKITGAGGGGCIFALTDESNLEYSIKQFKDNNYECFSVKIDFKGLDTF